MIPAEVDVIVAGGGPAGCVVAGRLARADENLQVLLMEAGANNIDGQFSRPEQNERRGREKRRTSDGEERREERREES